MDMEQPSFELREILERLKKSIRERNEADVRISGAWILVVILAPILLAISALILLSAGEGFSGINISISNSFISTSIILLSLLIGAVAAALIAVLYYKLIYRMNLHFKRSRMLRESLIDLVSFLSKSRGIPDTELSHLKTLHRELELRETKRSAGLNAILSIIVPFYWLYAGYFLTAEWQEHEAREKVFFKDAFESIRTLGIRVPTVYWEEMSKRSPGLYVILTIILGGLFAIYWLWTLIKDPEHHFASHRRLEDILLDSLESFLKTSGES